MKASPIMQAVIESLAKKHHIDISQSGAVLRLEMKHFDDLQIERFPNGCMSVAHYFKSRGQRIAEPDVYFWIGDNGVWFPINITQSMSGYQSYAEIGEDGNRILLNQDGQTDLADFCEQWAQNLRDQRWLENATKHTLPDGQLFELGQIVATQGALAALRQNDQTHHEFIRRHVSGDWGVVPPEDAESNQAALDGSDRIVSAYLLTDQTKIWIITEYNRSVTTVLLPAEY